jgi:hypothetical protein
VGILETIDAMDLSDEEKARMRREYEEEVNPLRTEVGTLRTNDRREKVKTEILALSEAGFKDAPRALAFVRRLYLSPDAEEPGVVLFADHELSLTGEEATGATTRESMSVAQAFRTFFSLLPADKDGKLKVTLSDQGTVTDDHGKPAVGDRNDAVEQTAAHKESLGRSLGRTIDRPSRDKRYKGFSSGGGD